MGITFRKGYNLQPVAQALEGARTEGGFHASAYDYLAAIVDSATKFSPEPTRLGREYVVHEAIEAARKAGAITVDAIKRELEQAFAKYVKARKNDYLVFTHISTSAPPASRLRLPNSSVTFRPKLSPHVLEALEPKQRDPNLLRPPAQSVLVRSRVRVRLPGEAVDVALDDLDYLRGLWILWATRGRVRSSFGLQRRPMAPVVVGPIYTVHNLDGSLALDTYWWRNGYVEPLDGSFDERWRNISNHTAWARKRIGRMEIRSWLEAALRRYAVALDVTDWETAFTKLWSLLELLTNTGTATYDATVRRTLFVHTSDRALHAQALQHLRDFRNEIVHADSWSNDSEQLAWHLKMYVDQVLVFLISRGHMFRTIDELSAFMDLPRSRGLLLKGARWLR